MIPPSFPTSLCAILPSVSAAATTLAFFCFLIGNTLGLPCMLSPPPGALSPSSFHPAGPSRPFLPEHHSWSHPLKFSFPIVVSPCKLPYGTCDFYSICAHVVISLLFGSPARHPQCLFCSLPCPHLNIVCDTQWVLSTYLLDEWLFPSHFLGQTASRKEYFMTQENEWLWNMKKWSLNICVNEKKLSSGGSWEHNAQGDESGTRWLEMRRVDFVISVPYLS